jgi:3-oxoisoapionate kinase
MGRQSPRARPGAGTGTRLRWALPDGLLVAVYGDDFTGSAAVMEVMAFAGLPAALFLDLPTPEQLARFRPAGPRRRRHRAPPWPRPGWTAPPAHLRRPGRHGRAARPLQGLLHARFRARISAPSAGRSRSRSTPRTLGARPPRRAADPPLPVLRPPLRGAPGGVFRLDRHPVMARHPVTPMDESDVARHLARQTAQPIGCSTSKRWRPTPPPGWLTSPPRTQRLITLDTLDDADLARAAR